MPAMSGKARTALVAGVIVLVAAGAFVLGRLASDPADSTACEEAASSQPTKTGSARSSSETSPVAGGSAPTLAVPSAELPRLTTPPEKTLWALAPEACDAGVRVAVEFEPYGVGPSLFGPSIVAKVTSAESDSSSAKTPDLAGRNVVLLLGESVVDAGGRYRGVALTKVQQDRVVLVLDDVEPLMNE